MKTQTLSFGGSIPQNYEELLGPFLFEPFAVDLTKRIEPINVENVLELACGSRRLTKHISDIIAENVSFTASDLSGDMIAVAQTKVTSPRVKWATVDMLAIPFEDNHFDLIFCQFGIMLVPDQQRALSEIFRVLKKGGKVIFSTWADIADNQLWSIGNEILNAHLTQHPLAANPGPFSMSDEQDVMARLKTAGFTSCTATSVTNSAETASASLAANGFIQGLPVFSFIQQQAPQLLHAIISSFTKQLIERLGDQPLKVTQRAWLFEANK